VRSDLQKLPSVSDITTDFTTHIATFKLPKDSKLDLKAKLTEFAKTNEHMKGWTFIDDAAGGKGGKDGKGGKSPK
jgi:hypothetical protein